MKIVIIYSIILKDPTNLQTKVQKHQNFEAEVEANKNRIEAIQTSGETLLAEQHYASDTIRWVRF